MRLASFNVLHGRSLEDGQVDGERLRAAVVSLGVDVLGLQEVDRDQARSGLLDLTALAADGLGVGADQWRFASAIRGTPGAVWTDAADDDPPGEAAYGVSLLSRWPVLAWRTLRLRRAPVRSPVLIPGSKSTVVWLADEPRVGLAAVVESPVGPMTVVTTHLSFVPGWNGVQLRWLTAGLADLPHPQVLLGDLNMPGRLPSVLTGWRALAARTPTYPAWQPRVQLDHVLARGALPEVVGVETPRLALSDHRPLVVELARP